MATKKPRKLGRYHLRRRLGKGGMAAVFQAYDPNFDRLVAIKILPPEFLHTTHFRTRFRTEARIIASLEHPAIVPVYDFNVYKNLPYLVMRYMSGGTLIDRIAQSPTGLPLTNILAIASRIASALDQAHQKGIVHRDLKAANILFDEHQAAFLADFGIAKVTEGDTNITGNQMIGTPAYMSPEQAEGRQDIDHHADIYSFAILLFEMLTGQLPFYGETPMRLAMQHITAPVPPIHKKNNNLSPQVHQIFVKALAKNPQARYHNATDFINALAVTLRPAHIKRITPLKSSPPTPPPSPPATNPTDPTITADHSSTTQTITSAHSAKKSVRIPAGHFLAGTQKESYFLNEYWIDTTPITNAEYEQFIQATNYPPPKHWGGPQAPPDIANHPVTFVSLRDAQAYATWAHKRLPTELEWEKAARYTDGRIYPWGNNPPTPDHCNYESTIGHTTPVGAYSPLGDSPYGCTDMAGNVWEWTNSLYDKHLNLYTIRGGAWNYGPGYSRTTARDGLIPKGNNNATGFRLVLDQPGTQPQNTAYIRPQSAPLMESDIHQIRTWSQDNKKMVFIPAGNFAYGPNQIVSYLDGFWIDLTPVTNMEYARFLEANPQHPAPPDWRSRIYQNQRVANCPIGKERHPVTNVSWTDIIAYAHWSGKRIPNERQWEKAARGTDGRLYPWGNQWQPNLCNTYEAQIGDTTPVGQFSPQGDSPYGCVDIAGNVWEWTDSWLNDQQRERILRGGSWQQNSPNHQTALTTHRLSQQPNFKSQFIGFRLALPDLDNFL
ncbi:MAG TPA: bifunctional serine/threonine-protein kinase/formylglycine-generating enzyme family protein [Anaerolineae bacterium]|nr:bifunctional serine/threonine-protein kinase/formylglycine-generating enzyme family protein [Anaerolineae bacterium]